jgi:hypothetical protein
VADPPERPLLAHHTYPDGSTALLLFDGVVHNRGDGPLEMRGSQRSGEDMTVVRQHARVVGGGLEPIDPPPGRVAKIRCETADGHNHRHLREIARYSLWSAERTAEVTPGQIRTPLEDG